MAIKVLSRGFITAPFTYMRSGWNLLDITVIATAYIDIILDVANSSPQIHPDQPGKKNSIPGMAALRAFRVLRALKAISIVPGLRTIVSALIESVKALRDVIILTFFLLTICALVGLQLFTGKLQNKCIAIWPGFNDSVLNTRNINDEAYSWPILQFEDADAVRYDYLNPPMECEPEDRNMLLLWKPGIDPYSGAETFYPPDHLNRSYTSSKSFNYEKSVYETTHKRNTNSKLLTEWAEDYHRWMNCSYYDFDDRKTKLNDTLCQLYHGKNRTELVEIMNHRQRQIDQDWNSWNNDKLNLCYRSGFPWTCSNSSTGGKCAPGYICLQHGGSDGNPNFGFTSFDHFGMALLAMFRLMTQDYWENLYWIVMRAAGRTSAAPFFITGIYLCSFYLVNLTLAVVSMAYEEQHNLVAEEQERQRSLMDKKRQELNQILKNIDDQEIVRSRRESCSDAKSEFSEPNTQDELTAVNGSLLRPIVTQQPLPADTEKTHNPSRRKSLEDLNDDELKIVRSRAMSQASMIDRKEESCPPCWINNTRKYCIWECNAVWMKFQGWMKVICDDPFFDLFITLSIVINTGFMAAERQPMTAYQDHMQKTANNIFTTIFATEFVVKLVGMNPYFYFQSPWNIFDSFIVTMSLAEYGLSDMSGFAVLRTFRLMRVFKLAKSWSTLNMLLKIIGNALGALANLVLVLGLLLFIFAVVGMQLFQAEYKRVIDAANQEPYPHLSSPRWHMQDFFHSFLIVFRILCGEWIETMWDCIRWGSSDPKFGGYEDAKIGFLCFPVFLTTTIIGNLVVLNLFLALLLSSFSGDQLETETEVEEPNNIQLSIDRIKRLISWTGKKFKMILLGSESSKVNKEKLEREGKSFSLNSLDKNASEKLSSGNISIEYPENITRHEDEVIQVQPSFDRPRCAISITEENLNKVTVPKAAVEEDFREKMSESGSDFETDCTTSSESEDEPVNRKKIKNRLLEGRHILAVDNKPNTPPPEDLGSRDSLTSRGTVNSKTSKSSYTSSSSSTSKRSVNQVVQEPDCENQHPSNLNVDVNLDNNDPEDCFPLCCKSKCPCCCVRPSSSFMQRVCDICFSIRKVAFRIIEHPWFEAFIVFMILASSMSLAFENIYVSLIFFLTIFSRNNYSYFRSTNVKRQI